MIAFSAATFSISSLAGTENRLAWGEATRGVYPGNESPKRVPRGPPLAVVPFLLSPDVCGFYRFSTWRFEWSSPSQAQRIRGLSRMRRSRSARLLRLGVGLLMRAPQLAVAVEAPSDLPGDPYSARFPAVAPCPCLRLLVCTHPRLGTYRMRYQTLMFVSPGKAHWFANPSANEMISDHSHVRLRPTFRRGSVAWRRQY